MPAEGFVEARSGSGRLLPTGAIQDRQAVARAIVLPRFQNPRRAEREGGHLADLLEDQVTATRGARDALLSPPPASGLATAIWAGRTGGKVSKPSYGLHESRTGGVGRVGKRLGECMSGLRVVGR